MLIVVVAGLVLDLAILVGLLVGFVTLPAPDSWSRPEVVATLTFLLLVYSILLLLFFRLQVAKGRWRRNYGTLVFKVRTGSSVLILSYILWLPASIVWGLTMLRIFRLVGKSLSELTGPESSFAFFYFAIGVVLGGWILARVAISLYEFFNP